MAAVVVRLRASSKAPGAVWRPAGGAVIYVTLTDVLTGCLGYWLVCLALTKARGGRENASGLVVGFTVLLAVVVMMLPIHLIQA